MYRRHGDKLGLVFLGADLATTAAVWVGAYALRFALWPSPEGIPDFQHVLRALPAVLMVAAIAYRLCGLYEVHRLKQLPRELGVVCKASGLMFLLAITITFYRRDLYESRLALGLFLVLNGVALTAVRRLLWRVLKNLRARGLNHGRAVIVGAGRAGRRVAETIRNNGWTGLEAVGFVDAPGRTDSALLPRLGEIGELEQVVAEHNVDHVFIALPLARYGELPAVYKALSDLLVEVHLVPDVAEATPTRLRMLEVDNLVFLSVRESPDCGWPWAAKRAMDVVLGSVALVLLSPLLGLLALAVKLSSRGPILYRQARLGRDGKPFHILKFRSMHVDAEQASGPVWASRDDPRCTPLGRVMRRWSLDELPQLLNVLAGDMSLVGPRPERGVFVEQFRRQIPDYRQRHRVQAGMTGWAQVHGWRGDTSLRHRTQCDLYYVANWSLALDLRILLMTLWGGLRQRRSFRQYRPGRRTAMTPSEQSPGTGR